MYRLLRSLLGVAAFAVVSAGGCIGDLPIAGQPCPNGDENCDDGEDASAFFCSASDGKICLPGIRIPPAANLAPIVQAAAIVVADGATVRGTFSAVDPDGQGTVSFSLLNSNVSNGAINLATDGSYTFDADLRGGETAQSRFQILATDRHGGETVATVFAIVLKVDSDLLTWTGASSSDFATPENWTPLQRPTLEYSVFLPATSSFSPIRFDEAAVFNLYVGAGREFRLGDLEVFGDEVFSASAAGQGPLVLRSNPRVFGDLPSLRVRGGAHVESQVRVDGDLQLAAGSLPFVMQDGASLVVEGAVTQAGSSAGFLTPDNVAATFHVKGDLLLLGAPSRVGGSTILVEGDIQVANTIVASPDARLRLTGTAPQAVSVGPRGQLPTTTSQVGSAVEFLGDVRIAGDFDVGGELSIGGGGHVQVASVLTLRTSFRAEPDTDGRLTATECVVSPDITVPVWIECDVTFDAGVVDAGELDAGDFDAGELDAGDFDAGDVDAGELDAGVDAGELDAGVDAGELDAGVDAGELDAGDDAGAPSVNCVPPAERSGDILNGLIVVEAGTSASMDIVHASSNASVTFVAHALETEGGSSEMTSLGRWTFSAAASAMRYYDVPVSYSTASEIEHDCLRVRIVNPALEFNVIQPSAAAILSGSIAWNSAGSWDPPNAPSSSTTVFFPKAFSHPESIVRILQRSRGLLIETGAVVRLDGPATMTVAGEIAFGAGTSVEPGEVLLLGPGPVTIASAAPIPKLECSDSLLTLASSLRTGALTIETGCGLDVDDFTLRVDGAFSGSSLTYPTVQMHSASARILVNGDLDLEFTSETELKAGTLLVTGAALFTHFLDGDPVTAGDHTLILEGAGTSSVTSNGTLAHVEVRSPTASFELSSFEMESVDLGATSLCVDVLGGPAPAVASVSLDSGFTYNQGPPWSLGSCLGPTLECAALEIGGDNATCLGVP